MNRLEVEPVRRAGLELNEHVLRHGVTMGKSQTMELGQSDDRKFDRSHASRVVEPRILEQHRQRLSPEERQNKRSLCIDPNRCATEGQVDLALPLLPIPRS